MVCRLKHMFQFANVTLESKVKIIYTNKSVLWLITLTLLHFLMDDDQIWHNYCQWCVNDNEGIGRQNGIGVKPHILTQEWT